MVIAAKMLRKCLSHKMKILKTNSKKKLKKLL